MVNRIATLLMFFNLCACASHTAFLHAQKTPERLTIYDDGKMLFRDRFVNQEDVVIYPDGFGGERAAIKVRMPAKPDFYRDSIIVDRVSAGSELTLEHDRGKYK